MIIDFRPAMGSEIQPLFINGSEVEIVESFKFLGSHLSNDLGWGPNIDHCVKKAQQRMYFLRHLRGFGMSYSVLARFYRAVIESVLTLSITVWYGSTTVDAKKRLQRIVKTAETIVGAPFPSMETIYQKRLQRRRQL